MCMMGREKRAETGKVCLSCAKQSIACPFPAHSREKAPQGANLGTAADGKSAYHERGTRHGKKPGPNATETEYGRHLQLEFPGCEGVFEGLTIHFLNGHKYRPDWIVKGDGWILCVEVKHRGKDGYRLPSYQRAKLAYDQAKVEWSGFRWRWAEKTSTGWDIS